MFGKKKDALIEPPDWLSFNCVDGAEVTVDMIQITHFVQKAGNYYICTPHQMFSVTEDEFKQVREAIIDVTRTTTH